MNIATRKGASEIVGNVMMLLVVTALISQAFLYGMPILRKRIDESATSYMENAMKELADAIKVTALQGGETRVNLEYKAKFTSPPQIKLAQDQTGSYIIELRGSTLVARYAPRDIPLNDFIGPYKTTAGVLEKAEGIAGVNEPVVATASSIKLRGGIRLVMKVVPRPIRDTAKNVITEIELKPIAGKSSKASLPTTVIIKKIGERVEAENLAEGTITKRVITVGVGFE